MTAVSQARHGNRRWASCLRVMAICVFAMATWSPGQVEARSYGFANYFESRLTQLYHTLSARISHLEGRVFELAQQECQTGVVDFSLCPGFKEANSQIINTCVSSPIAGAGINVTDMTVTFARSFKRPPVVDATFSGMTLLAGKNCTLEVMSVQKNQFVIRLVADDLLPVLAQASFFACPSAIL